MTSLLSFPPTRIETLSKTLSGGNASGFAIPEDIAKEVEEMTMVLGNPFFFAPSNTSQHVMEHIMSHLVSLPLFSQVWFVFLFYVSFFYLE